MAARLTRCTWCAGSYTTSGGRGIDYQEPAKGVKWTALISIAVAFHSAQFSALGAGFALLATNGSRIATVLSLLLRVKGSTLMGEVLAKFGPN